MTRLTVLAMLGAAAMASVTAVVVMTRGGVSVKGVTTARDRRAMVAQDRDAAAQVDALLARADSTTQLLALYHRWAGSDDKLGARERILDALLSGADRRRGLRATLLALALDPSALDDDPMIDYAARRMRSLWSTPELYDYARDLMLVQPTDKTRVALAESLVQHTTSLPKSNDLDGQKRAWLSNDLVDVYYQSGNEARLRIARAAQQVAGDDLAKALGGVPAGDYAIVRQQAHDINAKLDELRARQSDPALIEVREQMRQLGTVDQSKVLDDMATRP